MKARAELLGVPVTSDAGRIGTVVDLLFDDGCSRVLALVMRSGSVFRTRQVLRFQDVRSIGPAAVVVTGPEPRQTAAHESGAPVTDCGSIEGKPVVTREGHYLGAVRDVLFDEGSGRVLGFEVAYPESDAGPHRQTGLPADLASVSADALVVSDVEAARQAEHGA